MRLGRHMPTHSNAVKAAEIARWLGCNAIQIFASNPTGWRPTAGNSLGGSFEQIGAVLNLLPQYQQRLGVCLDTAHLWGAGYDISTTASTHQVLQHFDEVIGFNRLRVIHLNDTEMALGSHRDVHARVGEGIIGQEGLRALLTDSRLDHVAVLLETPIKTDDHDKEDWDHDKQHLERVKELMQDEVWQAADI